MTAVQRVRRVLTVAAFAACFVLAVYGISVVMDGGSARTLIAAGVGVVFGSISFMLWRRR